MCNNEMALIHESFTVKSYLCQKCYYHAHVIKNIEKQEVLCEIILTDYGFTHPLRKQKTEVNKMQRKETPKLDVTKYIGRKAQIVSAEIIQSKFGLCLKLDSEAIRLEQGDTLPEGKIFRASLLLGFNKNPDGSCYIGENSALDKFMKSKSVKPSDIPDSINAGDRIKAFEGVHCVTQKSKTGFLELV
jgi:hypothetical protein